MSAFLSFAPFSRKRILHRVNLPCYASNIFRSFFYAAQSRISENVLIIERDVFGDSGLLQQGFVQPSDTGC